MSNQPPFSLRLVARWMGWHMRKLEPGVWHVPQMGAVAGTMFGQVLLGTEVIVGCTREELAAIVTHEQGHIAGKHGIWATVSMLLPWSLRRRINHWQEYRADEYTAERGHAAGMLSYFRRHVALPATDTHPATEDRVRRLEKWLQQVEAPAGTLLPGN